MHSAKVSDDAVLEPAILSCDREEVERVLDAARVVVGGGSEAEGAAQLLADAVALGDSVLDCLKGVAVEVAVGGA